MQRNTQITKRNNKQLAVRIKALVRKANSLNTHDYRNTKMTEILMMTLSPQLRKIAIKKRASDPSSIREPDLDFRKLVDTLEQAEITMKLEETENLKLQYVNRIETNTTHINKIQESDTDLIEKITEILNIYERNPNFKGKPSFKKWCNYCRRYGHSIAECRQKQQDNQNKPQKHKKSNKSYYHYMKKDQNLPNKNIYSNNSSGKPFPSNSNYSRNQSPYNSSYRGRSPERRNSRNFSQNRHSRSNSQNNQKIIHDQFQRQQNLFLHAVPIQTQGIDTIPIIGHETHHITEIETIHTVGIEVIQTIEIGTIQTKDKGITHIIDRIITDQMITIKTDHEIIHKIEIQVTIINTEIFASHHIGKITVIPNLNIDTEVTHQNIKDTLIKCKKMKKQLQTPQVLMTQEVMNYN